MYYLVYAHFYVLIILVNRIFKQQMLFFEYLIFNSRNSFFLLKVNVLNPERS